MMLFTGKKCYYLTALSEPQKRDSQRHKIIDCVCKCGNKTSIRLSDFNSKNIRSCGCNRGLKSIAERKKSLLKGKYRDYKYSAKRKKREFNLTLEEFIEIISSPCYYCGRLDSKTNKYKTKYHLKMKLNGIDRKVNSIGYVKSNCLSCCVICNRGKLNMPYNEFMKWLASLVKFRTNNGKQEIKK